MKLTPYVVTWAILAVIVLALALYRNLMALHEDDNLHLAAGDKSAEQLIAEIDDGFYVTDMIGMGVNLVTGDYSRGASGFWIEKGRRSFPVSEVTVAGNLLDMFRLLSPANDLEFRFGIDAPTVRVEGLTVAGR